MITVHSIFYGLTFIAQLDPQFSTAADTSRRALLETPELKRDIRTIKDEAEKQLYAYTKLTAEELAYVGYIYPLVSGKLSTKPFKNFKYEKDGVSVIPEIEYNYRDKTSNIAVFFIKSF